MEKEREHRILESVSSLDSDSLVETAYSGLVGVMNMMHKTIDLKGRTFYMMDTLNGNRGKDINVLAPLVEGLYIPGSKRFYWEGFVDPVDFPLPELGCVYIKPRFSDVELEFVTIKKIKKLPPKVYCSCKNPEHFYKTFNVFVKKNKNDVPLVIVGYSVISQNGTVHRTVDRLKLRQASWQGADMQNILYLNDNSAYHMTAGAISLLADRRYLWNIRTREPLEHPTFYATVNFGVEEEMVKSLVFARDNPLTDSGRKKPILHWVKSHKRRIKEKIDIDIKKHLRGITAFDLGMINFEITQPLKGS